MQARTRLRKVAATERRIAAELGGSRVPLSGAGMEKGDARVERSVHLNADGDFVEHGEKLAVESKRVFVGLSYSLRALTWAKIARARLGATPVLHVQTLGGELAVLPTGWWGTSEPIMRSEVKSIMLTAPISTPLRYVLRFGVHTHDITVTSWAAFRREYETRGVAV